MFFRYHFYFGNIFVNFHLNFTILKDCWRLLYRSYRHSSPREPES